MGVRDVTSVTRVAMVVDGVSRSYEVVGLQTTLKSEVAVKSLLVVSLKNGNYR